MDTQRLILAVIFFFSAFMLFEAWQRETRPPTTESASITKKGVDSKSTATDVPSGPSKQLEAPKPAVSTAGAPGQLQGSGETVRVTTDVLAVNIDTVGGTITRMELLQHRAVLDTSKNFVLFERDSKRTYLAQSGLIGDGLPNHNTPFSVKAKEYRLADGQQSLEVRLEAPSKSGGSAVKTYVFERGSYSVRLRQELVQGAEPPKAVYGYYQLARDGDPPAGDSVMMPTYTGVSAFTELDKYQKLTFADIEKGKALQSKTAKDGWIGLVQHYFVSAWVLPDATSREFYTKKLDTNLYAAGIIVPLAARSDGGFAQEVTLYAGPQDQDKLAAIAPGLDLTVDYGWLTIIATPLFWVLKTVHGWVGNWGIAIIVLTMMLKLLFFPLSAASYRSMAKMRVMAPKMQRLKEQYGDDRQRMQQAMMELYKTEKINPLGGCLPIVVQIPVFIALYWVLLASFELRQAPFFGWILDLAAPDPYYVLPVLMGATMIIQTRLNPEPPDPVQAKIMKIMPIAFSIFFFFFPAGLVLYWLVNNILSIAQQWHITRSMQRAAPAHGRR